MNAFQANTAKVVDELLKVRIVPVLVLNTVEDGMKMCGILSRCNLKAAEITFRTEAAAAIIAKAAEVYPDLLLGAGTILNTDDLHRAFNAGAKFAVAPGFNPTVVKEAAANALPFAPGICTPSEVEQAMELGCDFLKFFPAETAGGTNMLKSIAAPYKHRGVRFMPTGGVTAENAANYLSIPEVAAVGGTWLGKPHFISSGNWTAIEKSVVEAVALAERFHG